MNEQKGIGVTKTNNQIYYELLQNAIGKILKSIIQARTDILDAFENELEKEMIVFQRRMGQWRKALPQHIFTHISYRFHQNLMISRAAQVLRTNKLSYQ